jgi:2-polyprenyl-3-methyl-5-hydroxy-6-metoxy-1,4-benzoquinol methylase
MNSMSELPSQELELEAQSFDEQIRERLSQGHIPDLRRTENCDWFRNNIWRRPYLVDMLIGRVVRFFLSHMSRERGRVLEVGCGPGFVSLELARAGYRVVGLDVSSAALEVAERLARENPFNENWGEAVYVRADFLQWSATNQEKFDAIIFFGSLHHFQEPASVLDHALTHLAPGGRVMAYEPARDWWSEGDAAVLGFVRVLLSATGHWHEDLSVPRNVADFSSLVKDCLDEVQEAVPKDEELQSPMDNSSGGTEMLSALRERFTEIAYEEDTLLFDRVSAGIRFKDDNQARRLAEFIHAFELFALEKKLLNPGGFMFVGQRHK